MSNPRIALACAAIALMLLVSPSVKADPVEIFTEANGFQLFALGNSRIDTADHDDFDILIGDAFAGSNMADTSGSSFVTLLNPLTFIQGFTGINSEGVYDISFVQDVTVNGQTQTMNILASLTVGANDTISILSSDTLVFQFDTFSVSASVLPVTIHGINDGAYDFLCAEFRVDPANCDPVPEPATMVLLGTGLAGLAAEARRRRKAKRTL